MLQERTYDSLAFWTACSSAGQNFSFPSEVTTSTAERITRKIGGKRERGITGQGNCILNDLIYLGFLAALLCPAFVQFGRIAASKRYLKLPRPGRLLLLADHRIQLAGTCFPEKQVMVNDFTILHTSKNSPQNNNDKFLPSSPSLTRQFCRRTPPGLGLGDIALIGVSVAILNLDSSELFLLFLLQCLKKQ